MNGATGVGKTTTGRLVADLLPECIHLDGDLLWAHEFFEDPAAVDAYFARWLRLAAEISQSGHPVVFRGANNPGRWDASPLASYFDGIHSLALVADPEVHEARLRARELPNDVEATDPHFPDYLGHNRWLLAHADERLDTTWLSPAQAAEETASWIRVRLS